MSPPKLLAYIERLEEHARKIHACGDYEECRGWMLELDDLRGEPTAEEIEAAARRLWELGNERIGHRNWELRDPVSGKTLAEMYRHEATEALRAAWGTVS